MIWGLKWCVSDVSRFKKVLTFLTVISIAQTSSVFAQSKEEIINKPTEKPAVRFGEWKTPRFSAFLQGLSFSEGKNEENLVRVDVNMETEFRFSKWAHFFAAPSLIATNGRIQQRYDADASQSAYLNLRDTYVSVHATNDSWLENIEYRAGSHWQGFLNSSMLVSRRRTFFGQQEHMIFRLNPELRFKVVAQQVIPNSSSDNGFREDREKMPYFMTETVSLEWKNKDVHVEPFVTHYTYQSLPAVVAANSATIGNTVDGEVGPDSRFRYQFNGGMAGAKICLCTWDIVKPELFAYGIQNTGAPKGARRAQWVGLKAPVHVADQITVTPQYAKYFIETDVVPAAYNSGGLGHNNRDGQRIGFEMAFKKLGFEIEANYIEAKTIKSVPEQSKLTSFYIGVAIGSNYDVL